MTHYATSITLSRGGEDLATKKALRASERGWELMAIITAANKPTHHQSRTQSHLHPLAGAGAF